MKKNKIISAIGALFFAGLTYYIFFYILFPGKDSGHQQLESSYYSKPIIEIDTIKLNVHYDSISIHNYFDTVNITALIDSIKFPSSQFNFLSDSNAFLKMELLIDRLLEERDCDYECWPIVEFCDCLFRFVVCLATLLWLIIGFIHIIYQYKKNRITKNEFFYKMLDHLGRLNYMIETWELYKSEYRRNERVSYRSTGYYNKLLKEVLSINGLMNSTGHLVLRQSDYESINARFKEISKNIIKLKNDLSDNIEKEKLDKEIKVTVIVLTNQINTINEYFVIRTKSFFYKKFEKGKSKN